MQQTLRLGILGAARIARGAIMPAANRTSAVEITAVATREGRRARELRSISPNALIFENYESLLESPEVEAVYIPLPNSMHAEWTLRTIEAGKHVLCEKPFALEASEARRVVEAARAAGLTLMEGFMYRFHPQTQRLRELLAGGAAGEIRQVVSEFGHYLKDPSDVRGIGFLGGGALGDVGCYCVSGIRLAFGEEPRRASALASFDAQGADRELAGVLEFGSGLGSLSCGISSSRRERLEILGETGKLSLTAPFRPDKSGGTIEISTGAKTYREDFGASDPYLPELEEFAAAIREKREPAVGPGEMLGNARAVSALLESARNGGNARDV